jgi:hypothetical protein
MWNRSTVSSLGEVYWLPGNKNQGGITALIVTYCKSVGLYLHVNTIEYI